MSDRVLLLMSAILMAAASWAFWHFLGEDAFTVFSTLTLLCILIDNSRLRRKLRRMQQQMVSDEKENKQLGLD